MSYRSESLYAFVKENPISPWPVFVPSYNRPDAPLLKCALQEPEFPIVLCIREEQAELYAKYKNKIPILYLQDVNDISQTREQILQQASKYYDQIFMMDDDISWLDYMIPSKTKSGKESMRASRTCFGTLPKKTEILQMWMYTLLFDKEYKKIALSTIGYRPDIWSIKNANLDNKYNSGTCIQCIHINTKLLQKHGIHYRDMLTVGNEDYALQFDIMSAGLLTTVYKDLMYDCPAMNSLSGGCENMHGLSGEARQAKYVALAKEYYKNHPGITFTQTKRTKLETMKFNWNYWRDL